MQQILIYAAEAELDQCIVMVLRKEPFYGHLLGTVVRRIDSLIPTAAVTISPIGVSLVINPDFFINQLSQAERCAVIKHEILHLALKHLFRFEIPSINRTRLNLAADLVVNQLVNPWPLPHSAITLSTFPELQLKPNKSLEYYYHRLEKHCREDASFEIVLREKASVSHSDHSCWADCGGEDFIGKSADANCRSNVLSANPKEDFDSSHLTKQLARILEDAFNNQLKRVRARLSASQWGDVPGSIRALIEEGKNESSSRVDWKRMLRLFVSAGYRTRLVATTRRRSKRFGTYPGVRIIRERNIAVVVDTSGSIDPETLSLFFAEIALIRRTGTDVMVIECDSEVKRTYPYRGVLPAAVEGGGGTDFTPAFQWLKEESRQRFDGCIYLTDGYADAPKVKPPCRLLWVISPNGLDDSHLLWGKRIKISK